VELQHSELARKIVHIGVGVLAALLRYLVWWQAAIRQAPPSRLIWSSCRA
jgi:hypothetical protein